MALEILLEFEEEHRLFGELIAQRIVYLARGRECRERLPQAQAYEHYDGRRHFYRAGAVHEGKTD